MSEFNLSKKIFDSQYYPEQCSKIFVKDVKEFIKRLKEELMSNVLQGEIKEEKFCLKDVRVMYDSIDKLAGDKLNA